MNNIYYSIIIPHYDIIDLLLRCLRSIPNRNDVEIIIVDDCSEQYDICKKRIDEEFSQYNIKIYSTKKHLGPGAARNIGLDNAKGKWIIFEDSDDFFDKDINKILDLVLNRTEDIIFCHNKAVDSKDINKEASDYVYEDIIEKYIKTNNDEGLKYKHYSVWGKIYKHAFIEDNNLRFEKEGRGEDLLFSIKSGYLCNSLAVLPYNLNIITSREGSLSRSWKDISEWYRQFFPAHIKAMQYLHNNKINIIDKTVYDKLLFIMKKDLKTFIFMFNKLEFKEKKDYISFLISRFSNACFRKIGAIAR